MRLILSLILCAVCVTACTKHAAGAPVKPPPAVKPYETVVYASGERLAVYLEPRPNEYLEQFPLDTLKLVGTMDDTNGKIYGLVRAPDGRVYRVAAGDHLGQRDGKITEITRSKISLIELAGEPGAMVPGNNPERPAALTLTAP
jgi:type IV pilus assembly protein PilP